MELSYISLFAGIFLILFFVFDVVNTTFAPHGMGKVTDYLSNLLWRFLLFLSRHKGQKKVLSNSGTFIILMILSIWVISLWVGFGLIFCFEPDSVRNAQTNLPATTLEKFYFAGYTLSTLGYGDFYATTPFWKILSSAISFSGLIIITTAITYLVPVTNAAIQKRKLSLFISTMGNSPREILKNGWNGKNFSLLDDYFQSLTDMILTITQSHKAYPILHYFHTANKYESSSLSLVALDETLTILIWLIPKENQGDMAKVFQLRKAMSFYLETLHGAFIKPANQSPDFSYPEEIKALNLPLKNEDIEVLKNDKVLKHRREILNGSLVNQGWTWKDIYFSDSDSPLIKMGPVRAQE
jgi:hypothetical protein